VELVLREYSEFVSDVAEVIHLNTGGTDTQIECCRLFQSMSKKAFARYFIVAADAPVVGGGRGRGRGGGRGRPRRECPARRDSSGGYSYSNGFAPSAPLETSALDSNSTTSTPYIAKCDTAPRPPHQRWGRQRHRACFGHPYEPR
jgi:hypothetical protein